MPVQPATTESVTAWDAGAVTEFDTGSDDILVLARSPLDRVESAIQAARFHEYFTSVHRENVAREVRAGLGEFQIKSPELATDLTGLAASFLDQFDLPEARMRIEVTRSQPCPKFHCDNVNVRLVTTYVGPTTEYQHAGENTTHAASLGGLVFLKGHQHPTHQDTVHHRSPEVPAGEKRLCVAIDF